MEGLRKVALAGAAGVLGSHIFNALVASGRYSLTVLTREESNFDLSSAVSGVTVEVIQVDYECFDSLRNALEGQDVLVSVLGKAALASQPKLIDAAVAARVKRIIPSEFGGNLRNAKCREFPIYQAKVEVEEQLERHRAQSGTSYTLIFNNVLLDWGLTEGLMMAPQDRRVRLYDSGNSVFSTTSMATVGRAVVGVLDRYRETSNRAVYVHDIAITQNELVAMAQKAIGDDGWKEWTVVHESTAQLEAAARSDLARGLASAHTFFGFAVRAAFAEGYGGHFHTVDNELLGILEMDRKQLQMLVSMVVAQ